MIQRHRNRARQHTSDSTAQYQESADRVLLSPFTAGGGAIVPSSSLVFQGGRERERNRFPTHAFIFSNAGHHPKCSCNALSTSLAPYTAFNQRRPIGITHVSIRWKLDGKLDSGDGRVNAIVCWSQQRPTTVNTTTRFEDQTIAIVPLVVLPPPPPVQLALLVRAWALVPQVGSTSLAAAPRAASLVALLLWLSSLLPKSACCLVTAS